MVRTFLAPYSNPESMRVTSGGLDRLPHVIAVSKFCLMARPEAEIDSASTR